MIRQIDHIVILVNELEQAIADYTGLGFTVVRGGDHPGGATHNALVVFADGAYFELILVLDVIEHLQDYFQFLCDLKGKGRHKIFHIPLDLCVQTVFRKHALLKRRDMYGHLHYFTKETAVEALRETGYESLDCFYTPRANALGTAAMQRLLKLPRKIFFTLHRDLAVRVLGGYSLLVLAR